MEINNIKFRQDDEIGAIPETVSVTMSIEEAAWIAKLAGKTRGGGVCSSIYSALVGDVFDRYWEEGVAEIRGVEIPPIVYE